MYKAYSAKQNGAINWVLQKLIRILILKLLKKKKSDEVTAYQIGGRSSALVTAGLLEGGAVQLPKHKEGNQDEDQRYCKLYSLHSHTKVSYCK